MGVPIACLLGEILFELVLESWVRGMGLLKNQSIKREPLQVANFIALF